MKRQHQAEDIACGKNAIEDGRSSSTSPTNLIAYKDADDFPTYREMAIQVDEKNEAIIFPLYGYMVPFHVANVKTVHFQADTCRNCHLRIIFDTPVTPFSSHETNSSDQMDVFLKEISFRSKDPSHISQAVLQIERLKRNMLSQEFEASLVTQEKLLLAANKFKPVVLTDLWIRPVVDGQGRKLPGTLEAHVNGFRFSISRSDEPIYITFGNIKHAFFQAADKEIITLLHFHLHNHIMVGNEKTKDVQFYVEVMDVVHRNKINMDFQSFVNRVNDLWGQKGIDRPLKKLGFHGVTDKAPGFIIPTSSCLVKLTESPFVVVTLGETEIVNLERVGFGQKNFDMAIVFKEFKKDVLRIDSIPSTSLDGIKEWLDTTDIRYYETRFNMNWQAMLKTIADDPQNFINDGGWEFLDLEASDSDSDGSWESDGSV